MSAGPNATGSDLIAGPNDVLRESLVRKLAALREELGEPDASPLDQLLVSRVVTTWLQTTYADAHFAQLRQQQAPAAQLRVVERFLTGSNSRYLSAIRALAQLRKLMRPVPSPIQIATRLDSRTRSDPRRSIVTPEAGLAVVN